MATLDQLNALAAAVPVMNQKAARQASAAKTVGLQQQIGTAQAPPGQTSVRTAQAAAPQATLQQAEIAANTVQQNTQQLTDVAQTGLAAQGAEAEAGLQRQQNAQQLALTSQENQQKIAMSRQDIAMRKRVTGSEQASAQRLQKVGIEVDNKLQIATLRQREQLDRLGGDVKDKIINSRLQFDRDEIGRKFTNDRQLADYALANAKTELEFKEKMREVQQTQERKIQLMEIAEKKMLGALENNWIASERQLDNENRAKIAKMAADMREAIEREKAGSAGRMAMWQAGGTIAGAVAGSFFGPAGTYAGAAAGAAVGGAVGTAAGGYVEGQRDKPDHSTGVAPPPSRPAKTIPRG
jgi:hypothetical protein